MSLYAHRLARIIERRSLEAANPNLPNLEGMTHAEHQAAHGLERRAYMSAHRLNRMRALMRAAVSREWAPVWGRELVGWER